MHNAKYFALRTFEDAQRGVIRGLAHPLGGLQPTQDVPAPFHGHASDLLLCSTAHGALLWGHRHRILSKYLENCGFPCLSWEDIDFLRRQEPARRRSRDVVDKFGSHSLQTFFLSRDKTAAFGLPMYCQQCCGHILWAGETWLWSMWRQLMVPRVRTEVLSIEIPLPDMAQGPNSH